MANYNNRRGPLLPNIEGLNNIPSEWDLQNMNSTMEDDLSLFTNGGDFLFDIPDMNNAPQYPQSGDMSQPSSAHPNSNYAREDFNFQNFTFPDIAPHLQGVHGRGDGLPLAQSGSPSTEGSPSVSQSVPRGEKRKSAAPTAADDKESLHEDSARMAAEEDKRRRNTAASARFRVKKKQREQAMEKTAKEMTDRVSQLEAKVQSLESENKILRDLLTDKVGKDIDVAELHTKFPKADAAESKTSAKKTKSDATR